MDAAEFPDAIKSRRRADSGRLSTEARAYRQGQIVDSAGGRPGRLVVARCDFGSGGRVVMAMPTVKIQDYSHYHEFYNRTLFALFIAMRYIYSLR